MRFIATIAAALLALPMATLAQTKVCTTTLTFDSLPTGVPPPIKASDASITFGYFNITSRKTQPALPGQKGNILTSTDPFRSYINIRGLGGYGRLQAFTLACAQYLYDGVTPTNSARSPCHVNIVAGTYTDDYQLAEQQLQVVSTVIAWNENPLRLVPYNLTSTGLIGNEWFFAVSGGLTNTFLLIDNLVIDYLC